MKKALVLLFMLTLAALSATAQVTSMLWGVDGEAWDPETSMLNDFSDVGYMNGNVAIPTNWPVGTDVTDYGAVPDDEISDFDAFMAAIAACPPNHAIFVPKGTYWITDCLQVSDKSNFVLRGEDMYETVLYFPTNMSVLYPEDEYDYRYSVIAPPAVWWMKNGTNMNIEHVTIEFTEDPMIEHFNHDGRQAIHYQSVSDSWIRNVCIRNANDGVVLSGGRRITAMNIVLDQYAGRHSGAENTVGHHGLVVRGARYCLFHNCFITGMWQHDLISADKDIHNVYSRIRMIDGQIDHHAMGADPRDNLWTDIDCGEGLRIWEQGGNVSGYDDTIWNVYETQGTGNTNRMFTPDPARRNVVVGLHNDDPTSIGTNWHHEAVNPFELVPQNIYLAQLEKLGKPIPGPLIDFDIRPSDPRVIKAIDDTYIDKVSGDLNFSWHPNYPCRRAFRMLMKYGNVHDRQPWMKFDFTDSAFTGVDSATLSVYCNSANQPTVVGAYGFSNDNWSEDTITWNNKPAGTATLLSSVSVSSVGTTYEWDVTDFVNAALTNGGDRIVTIYLQDVNRTDVPLEWRPHEGAVWHPTITLESDSMPPAAPTGITAVPGDGSVSLDWDDHSDSNVTYSVYRSTTPSSYGGALTNGLTASGYVDSTAVNGTIYYYVVTASDTNSLESAWSSEVLAIPAAPGNAPPVFNSDPVVETNAFEWTAYSATLADDASDPETDDMIFSKISGPAWLNVASAGGLSGTPARTDAGLNSFTVRVDAAGGSDTATLEITVDTDTTPPAAPTGLAATAGEGSVSLDWNNNTEEDLASYSIYRSTNSGIYGAALVTGVGSSGYVDNTAVNGITYYYVVTALDDNRNESPVSGEVSATPVDVLPAAPTGLTAAAGDGAVSLNWNDNTEGDLASYSVYRSTTAGSYGSALVTGLTASQYDDTSAVNETTYYYVVTAVDDNSNESPVSGEVSATPSELVGVEVTATENGGFEGASTQNVSERLQTRNAFSYGSGGDDYAYLRFVINAAGDTIGGVAVADITSVSLDVILVGDTRYNFPVFGLDDLANPGAGFLTETTWSDSNLTEANAPHGNVDLASSSLATSLGSATATGVSIGSVVSIDLDLTKFKNLIAGSSNDEITLIVSGDKNFNSYFASIDNTGGHGVPTLSIEAEPPLTGYALWASGWGTNDIGAATNDFDFDGLDNLYEYGVDGNPTDGLLPSNAPTFTNAGGAFLYIHPKRSDDETLIYTVETTTNLVDGVWTNDGYTVIGTNVTGETLDFVTNDVDTAHDERFIRLKIEL